MVVVGGGPTGVETTGALAELMDALHKTGRLDRLARSSWSIAAMPCWARSPSKAHGYALDKLTKAGAEIRLGLGVTAVHADRVEFDDGSMIATRTVVWGGGESASAVAQTAGPAPGRGGRIDVQPDLSVPGYPGCYAVGDVANIPTALRREQRCRNWGRWPSSRASGQRRTSSASCTGSRPSPSSTRTRASWR